MKKKKNYRNPYKYKGALDPQKHKHVCVPRTELIDKIAEHIDDGEFCVLLGPRQIGKTTLLRLFKEKYKNKYHIVNINLQTSPETSKAFYSSLVQKISKSILTQDNVFICTSAEDGRTYFRDFLANFLTESDKQIVLMFDEIMGIPKVSEFLNLWRSIYEDRLETNNFNKYSIIITGNDAVYAIINESQDDTSPFDIAEHIFIEDFSYIEAELLIDIGFSNLGIKITDDAKSYLILQIGGHPQMLQHLCHYLVDKTSKFGQTLKTKDVEDGITNCLFFKNTSLATLSGDINSNPKLKELTKNIITGKKQPLLPNNRLRIFGAGAITDDGESNCTIRNKVYERYLKKMLANELGNEIFWETDRLYSELIEYQGMDSKTSFIVKKKIGAGGFGEVFLAEERNLGRLVAIKKLNKRFSVNQKAIDSFCNEAQIIARMKHDNIVVIHRFEKKRGEYRIVMEYIDGPTLENVISQRKDHFSLEDIICFAKILFRTLEYTHANGIVHKDIKPNNIMIDQKEKIKIVDFGIAKFKTMSAFNEPGTIVGHLNYIPPEQAYRPNIGAQADIYAAGITLFQFITGEVPYNLRNIQEFLEAHLSENIPSIMSKIPFFAGAEEVDAIIKKCIAKNEIHRYQKAGEVVSDLDKLEKRPLSVTQVNNIIKGWLL